MDWLRDSIGAGETSDENLAKAFRDGEEAAKDFVVGLIDRGRPLVSAGHSFEASVLLFTAIWRAVGIAQAGVDMTIKEYGEKTPVKKIWDILSAVLSVGDSGKGLEALRAMKKAEKRK